MKTLPALFARNGFSHKLVIRDGMLAIYERKHSTAQRPHFETIRIRVWPERTLHGRMLPLQEAYPSSEQWGAHGWTYATLKEAQQKLAALKLAAAQPTANP